MPEEAGGRREESSHRSAQPRLRTADTRLRLRIPEAREGDKAKGHVGWGGGERGGMLVVHTPKQEKKNKPKNQTKTQPQIDDENGLCSILRKLPISPRLQSGLSLLSDGAGGDVAKRRRQAAGGGRGGPPLLLAFPRPLLRFSPATPAFPAPTRRPSRRCIHPPGGGRRAGESGGEGGGPVATSRSRWWGCREGPAAGLLAGAAARGRVLLALGSCLVQRMLQSRFPSAGV